MMNFYRLTDIETGRVVSVNPKAIEYYMIEKDYVQIETSSMYMHVALSEFNHMMALERINVYWNTLQFIELW